METGECHSDFSAPTVVSNSFSLRCSICLVAQSCPTLCNPMECSPPGSSVHGDSPWGFSRQENRSGLPCLPPGDLPNPETELRSPALQVDSLPPEPPGKPIQYAYVPYFGLACTEPCHHTLYHTKLRPPQVHRIQQKFPAHT